MCSDEVKAAIGEAAAGLPQLEERAAELRAIVDEPTPQERAAAELAEVNRQIAAQREAKAQRAAKVRQVGIRRAHGSKRAERERLLQKRLELANAYAENSAQLRAVDDDLERYEAEDRALADRFDVARSDLPPLTASGATAEALEAHRTVHRASLPEHHWPVSPKTEQCEHRLRERRTYQEVADTPGFAIITEAGLKPFPELTERQRKIIAERAREQEQMRRQLRGLPDLARIGSIGNA
jgi:hypothetical protein